MRTPAPPQALYPLPSAAEAGPLERLAESVRLRAAALSARWLAPGRLAAEGERVASRVEALGTLSEAEAREALRTLRGQARRAPGDAGAQDELLALAGAAWRSVGAGGPVAGAYAVALAVMRGRLADTANAEDGTVGALLAALAQAPRGGGVHVVAPDAMGAETLAGRLRAPAARLGLAVGCIAPGMSASSRQAEWAADVTCAGATDLVADALHDLRALEDQPGDIRLRLERLHGAGPRRRSLLQRGLRCAVLPEASRLLLDEALRTVALSDDEGAGQELTALALAWDVSALFVPGSAWVDGACGLTGAGRARLADMLASRGGPWSSPAWRARRVELALVARHALGQGVHYTAAEDGIQPVEPAFSARVPDLADQRVVLGLLALRHGCPLPRQGSPVASMSFMECFVRYRWLGGAVSGVDRVARRELRDLYGLPVVSLAACGDARERAEAAPGAGPLAGPAARAAAVRARAEHRKAAGRLQKLLAFSGRK